MDADALRPIRLSRVADGVPAVSDCFFLTLAADRPRNDWCFELTYRRPL